MSAEDANARYLRQASRRVIEPCEMSEPRAHSGWAEAAAADRRMGEQGDYSRACVLDLCGAHPWPPVRDRARRGLRRGPLLPNIVSCRGFDRGDRSDRGIAPAGTPPRPEG
jgi:hypothetical protein